MAHAARIAARLPPLYAEGELLGAVLDTPGLALEILDEDAVAVQQAHWFDLATEREEAARLAALLGIAPQPWQDLPQFRAWVHALRTGIVEHGAVSVRGLQVFVEEYLRRLGAAEAVPGLVLHTPSRAEDWGVPGGPAFTENPLRPRWMVPGPVAPLTRCTVVNAGLHPAPAGVLLVGLADGPEYVPVVANVTTGEALAYLDAVGPGQRLWLRADGTAALERRDVTASVRSIRPVVPGAAWTPADTGPAQPLTLAPGENTLWFLSVAHFGAPGLDRVLLALASLDLTEGRWDASRFDAALFAQEPAVALAVAWHETQPATVAVDLPGGGLLARAGHTAAALTLREQVGTALDAGVDTLAAAGVATAVRLAPLQETAPQTDFLTGYQPLVHREVGPTGADTLPTGDGVFDVTAYSDSTYA
jgi:hypothetical protein